MDLKGQMSSMTDRTAWAGRGASFMAKVKATKAVWFPPRPAQTGRKVASASKKATKKTAKKTTGSAKKAGASK
jgi:hypothetical protein